MPNIITAVFGGNSRYCTTRPVFQVDRGDVLKFVGLDLPEYYEVHFSNSKQSLATRVLATGDSVVIPWEFMRHGQQQVFAWIYLTPDAETGYTPYQVTIPLATRSDISNAQPTPAQEDIVAEAISALNEGVERTEKAADDAENAVRHYPRIVNGYWQVWDVDTQTWQKTGVKAVGEDGLPGRDGRDGVDGQDGAPGVTYTPTVSADGEISWTNDGGLPNPQPRDIMGPAGQDGHDGAPGPNQVTTNTATNITGLLKGDGSTVSAATPGTDYATPQQVNAKYTKPASGIPKSDMAQDVQTSLGKADTAIQPADYAPAAKTVAMTQPVGADSNGKLWTAPGGGGGGDYAPVIVDMAGPSTVCSFPDGIDNKPMKQIVCEINPLQSGAGDPSPQNIRPISGFTGLTISHSGADLSDPETLAISWQSEAGTVYGGTLTVNEDGSGELVRTHAAVVLSNLTYEWRSANSRYRAYNLVSTAKRPASNYKKVNAYCEMFIIKSALEMTDLSIAVTVDGALDIRYDEYADNLNSFLTAISGAKFVYELKNPIAYQFSNLSQLSTLFGTNNVWHDANGDIAVEYRADTKLYIQKINTPTDDDMVANAQIASGKYFIIGNNLYKSTTVIPAGDAIVPGTNCTLTNLAAALNAINA